MAIHLHPTSTIYCTYSVDWLLLLLAQCSGCWLWCYNELIATSFPYTLFLSWIVRLCGELNAGHDDGNMKKLWFHSHIFSLVTITNTHFLYSVVCMQAGSVEWWLHTVDKMFLQRCSKRFLTLTGCDFWKLLTVSSHVVSLLWDEVSILHISWYLEKTRFTIHWWWDQVIVQFIPIWASQVAASWSVV